MPKFKVVVEKSQKLWGWRLEVIDSRTVKIKVGKLHNWEKIVEERREWIEKKLLRARKPKKLKTLKYLELLGQKYTVSVEMGKFDSMNVFGDKKEIYIRARDLSQKYLAKIIDKKMRPIALRLIREEVSRLARLNKIVFGHVRIKNQKTRFGSCSGGGNLNFNWQIVLFPRDKFEHIILHELCHILIKNHSAEFWKKLTEMDKNAIQNNKWLKREGINKFLL